MAARPRARIRRDWPTGLSESRPGYYVWFNPITKNYVRIGRVPLAEARIQAMEANIWASGQAGKARLVDRIQQQDKTVSEWLEEWVSGVENKSSNTIRNYRVRNKAIVSEIGEHALGRLSVQDVAKALDSIRVTRGGPTAKGCRAVMVQAFNKAVAKGLMTTNPVMVTETERVTVVRERFTRETFAKVWKAMANAQSWLRAATLLGIMTGLRREDVADLKFSDVVDDYLLVEPKKNRGKVKIAIPLELRMEAMSTSLREVIADCRRTGVVSKYMVHQTVHTGRSAPGRPISLNTITNTFKGFVNQALGEGEHRPTYHELRSLCKRLYIEQGGVDTKALLGHTTDSTAALYANNRGAEFQKVRIG